MLPIALVLAAAAPSISAPTPAPTTNSAAKGEAAPSGQPLGYLTANELSTRCKDRAPGSISYCFAYIAGINDTMRAYEIWLGQREFCPPRTPSQSELRQAFIGYLTAYPSNGTGQAASVVAVALRETYPCFGGSGGSAPAIKVAPRAGH